ncbi:PTS cellobiose transporter subunit IIC [Megamonas hypermegale]|uniref:PTS sugar transporter subunit IIC n=1 Tax=Megamonas hypermegale TaxID=158847 RepID=UPI000B39C0ED|nr:PTS transporter subunit EIIC [Megamonas hypermegale]MDM8142422.1 PTS transporter subunit EIIC [Megamonas hypermegale]OUO39813.1 PTS cellobiose transporter subunit IIC [Megamonas hypermegale]
MSKQAIFDKFIELMGRFAEIKEVAALRDGFIFTTPFTIAGSIFLLLANLPIPGYNDFMISTFGADWSIPLTQVSGATFDILGIIVVLGITYKYTEAEGCDAFSAAVLALSAFVIIMKTTAIGEGGVEVGGVIPKLWAGSNGILAAIVVGVIVSKIFCYCEKNKVTIKMPESVPGGVQKAFAALIPAVIIFALFAIIYAVCNLLTDMTFPELVFAVIQTPLQSLTDTLGGGIVISALPSVLFWAGIHGPNIVSGITNPMLIANALDNQQLVNAGMSLFSNPQAKIVTIQMTDIFFKSGGCGMTLGFLIAAFIKAKSAQLKSISRLSFIPGLFNVNEPIIFGLPIVFNPYLLFPFVLAPVVAFIVTYFAIFIGFMPAFSAVQVPWTTPPILAGLIVAGWQGAVVQIVNIIIATVIYFPFVVSQDKANLRDEQESNQ